MNADTTSKKLPALISLVSRSDIPKLTYICSDKFLVGRGYEATLKLLSPAVSRKHCTLEKDSSNEWIITSHTRNPIEINTTSLITDQSKTLKCGDKITFPGVCSFVFKCNPDRSNGCCCDETRRDIIVVDLAVEDSEEICSPISVVSQVSSELSTKTTTNTTTPPCVVLPEETSSPTKSNVGDSTPQLKLNHVLGQEEEHSSEVNELNDAVIKLKEVMRDQMNLLKQLNELDNKLSKNVAGASIKASSSTTKNLISLFKEDKWKSESINLRGSRDEKLGDIFRQVKALLKEQREIISNLLLEHRRSSPLNDSSSRSVEEEEKPVVESVSETDTAIDKPADDDKLKDELKTYKQNSEWQEARIQYLEMKLKERDMLEKELESAKEETECLQTQVGEMRTKLSKVEVLELEVTYLKERSKYQEDDKRDKDELENRIQTLKHSNQKSKQEVEIITMAKSILENQMMSLRQKCEEIEKKLNTKVGCSSNQATGEYCCDLFSSLKDNVLEALEKEFTCCICNEMFVGATVTNCNHVFCAYCLKEWKKKKKQCPFCRAALTSEHRAKVIDECIANIVKIISDKMFAERSQMIEDRKNTVSPPPSKRARRTGGRPITRPPSAVMPVPLHLRNHPFGGSPAISTIPYAHQNFVIDLINLG